MDDWRKHGAEALHSVRIGNPATYLNVSASLLGKDEQVEVNINHKEPTDGLMSVEENIKSILDEIDKDLSIK
ncbi:hypothetical protein CC99x_007770 [Candidatus Berkiella cookevillensis]|uniref:Uncharacterized protein n=1 Tax=Candidatus Berkiella cookevillensis TaxID=437022 RepID=A0A0Q9YHF6_9GAMM|nr:hypothetical protein [Candidatus Berkiella cookevillensis]MCS5708800.1 hypothetical protein [Candidatus Berkiella cookevillensis]